MLRRFILGCVAALWLFSGSVFAQDSSVDAFRLVETLPTANTLDYPTDGLITAVFNRPVVPLTAVEAQAAQINPLRFEPALSGSGEWLNSAIYLFRPDPALAAGISYQVTIDPALTALDGSPLDGQPTWQFTTTAPRLVETTPERETVDVRLENAIQLTFNMPMDRASVERGFTLRPTTGERSEPVSGSFTWNDDSTGVRFQPDERLQLSTDYKVALFDAQGAGGGSGLPEDSFNFTTVSSPRIIRTDPFDGQSDASLYGVTFYFASPMNPDTLADKVTIDPAPWREPDIYYSDWDFSYNLSFPVEPSITYTVTLAPGAEDIYGNAITEPFVLRYTTQAYEPNINLEAPYSIGFYSAAMPQTQVYLTYRNISTLDLALYRLSLDEVLRALAATSYDPAGEIVPNVGNLIRSWQVPSAAPLNMTRYELLDLGSTSTCEGALPSRLLVGDSARVVSDPDPIRARAVPGSEGEIVTLLYRDYALEIIGGPQCLDGVVWWEAALREGQTAWVAEGVGEEYFVEPTGRSVEAPVTVAQADGSALAPGVYYLSVESPETAALGWNTVRQLMVVGSANLTLKQSIDGVLVWATDVATGLPIAERTITLYDWSRDQVAQGVTDSDGLVRFDLDRANDLYAVRAAVLQDEAYFGIGLTSWADGIDGYNFGFGLDTAQEAYRAYVYTDRPIYRPDQPVYFRGVVRSRDDVNYSVSDLREVPVEIYGGDDGALLYSAVVPLTPYGTFSGQFDLAPDAPLGYYRIVTGLPRPNPDQPYYGQEGTVSFTVAQYRAPEFQVDVTPELDAVTQGDTLRVVIDSRYFFGGAVSSSAIEWRAIAQPYFYSTPGAEGYSFVDFNYDAGPSELFGGFGGEVASGSTTTDAAGRAVIELPADLRDSTQSVSYTLEATVTDESGQAVSGRTDVVVHKGDVYVGLRPQEYVGVVGEASAIDLLAVDWRLDGAGTAGQTLDVQVVERRWSNVMEEDPQGRTTWSWEVEEIPVTEGQVTTDEQGRAVFSFTPPAGGVYKIYARTRDDRGNEIVASTQLWVSSRDYVVWRQQNSNRIDLIADRDSYAVGDTAELLIASPFQGSATALITVERGDVLLAERITLEGNSTVYRLPILADYAPNVYVSVLIVKGLDENNPVAAFRMGLINLGVDNRQRELDIAIEPDRDQAGPGDTVTYTVRTTDSNGQPVAAEVGVGLTDVSVLSIAPPNTIPLLDYFYGPQGLGVRTATPLTINTDQITQEILDTVKGGGGGFGEGGIFDIREEFVDTAYWNAALVTDANGTATFSVTLPDNLTTWRLDARAVTLGDAAGGLLVGQTTLDLLSTKPLLIRPVTPRFVVVGDRVIVAAVVNNNSGQEQTVNVRLDIDTPGQADLLSPALQTVTLGEGGRARVEWELNIGEVEALGLLFSAQNADGTLTDASRPPLGQGAERTLPVVRYDAPETVATAGVLAAGESVTEGVEFPVELGVTRASATVNLQPSLINAALDALKSLELPPNPSTEALINSFLPNLMLNRVLSEAGVVESELAEQTRRNIERAVQALYAAQRVDGGWGWYLQDRSNPTVSAYVLIGLSALNAETGEIDSGVITRAQNYLTSTLIAPAPDTPRWQLNRQSLMFYALALSGAPDVSRMAVLYEYRESMALYAQALLAQSFSLNDPADGRVQNLLDGVLAQAILSATGTHWEEAERDFYNWNSDTRTTAIILNALLELRPQSEQTANVMRWLLTARRADAWPTGQETTWALMAMARYIALTGDIGLTAQAILDSARVSVNGAALPLNVDADQAVAMQPLPTDTPSTLTIENFAPGTLYYTAQVALNLPMQNVGPLNRGVIVERRYTDEDGQPVTSAVVGDLITVRLTIIAPNDLHFVSVEDPIPAGTDAVNPDLLTSQQVGTQPELNPSDPLRQGWGWWWFGSIQFRDDRVVLNASYLPAGTYEFVYSLRAGLPGTYNVLPATAYEVYFPEVFGRSAGAVFTIGSAQ